jgi:iron complex outermembrane receptor protein
MQRHILFFVFTFLTQWAFAQHELKGTIIDGSTNKPIMGVHVQIVGNPEINTTNADGIFKFNIAERGVKQINVSHVSYGKKTITVTIPSNEPLIIKLVPVIIEINPVIVSATRSENNLENIPAKVNYISSTQITIDPGKSLDDALQNSSGIYINRNFGILSAKSSVSARGLSSKDQSRMLVLVDGVPVNKTDGGGVNWNLFNKATIESMEVLKGPGSALYGNNAMAGVINITTKVPTQPIQGTVGFEYGTYNTGIGRFNVMGRTNKNLEKGFYWMVSGLWSKSDGYITYPENLRTEYTVKTYMNEIGSLSKIGYDINKNHNVEFNFTYYDDKHGAGDKVYEEDGSYSKYKTYRYAMTYKGKGMKSNWIVNAFWLDEYYGKLNESMKDQSYQLYDVTSNRRDFGLLGNYNYDLAKNNKLTVGFDLKQGSVDAADVYYSSTDKVINQGKMDFIAGYIQDEWALLQSKLRIQIGTRFDYANYHDGAFYIETPSQSISYLKMYENLKIKPAKWQSVSPKIALQYELSKSVRTFASYGIGFRPPVLDDMCRNGKISGGFKVVNPNLKPEHIQTAEWGWKINWKDKIALTPSVWYSLGTDFMYYVSTGDSAFTTGFWSPVLRSENISEVELYGFELDATYSINDHFTLFGNYAYTQNKILKYELMEGSKLTDLTGKHLTDVPNHQFMVGGTWRNKIVNATITNRYVGEQWVNDANTEDTKYGLDAQYASYNLTDVKLWRMVGRHVSLGASIINIFDHIYLTSKSQINPGRMIYGEVKLIF